MGDLCGFRHDDLNAPSADGMFDNPLCGSGTGIDIAWGKPDVVARTGWHDKGQWGAFSLDGGKSWTPFTSMPKGKGAGSIAVSADGAAFAVGAQGGAGRLFQGPGRDLGPRRGASHPRTES